ncbi:rhomboid family protein [Anaerophilus nitritogenes]|uniref:rhomboid family protein n=1 Tax=Anaerophilus nitritogenes TaxID=2498136 RepID=UPI00101D59CE|nr:rhomboid family intramembrane serine protease [Anaerophilus nitritogenes]
MIRWIGLWIKYFIEKEEFFIDPHKQFQNIYDIVLHKQFWLSHFFIHFLENDFLYNPIDYQKSILYNQYKEIKMKNSFQKLFFYKIIFLEEQTYPSFEELSIWLQKENIPIHIIGIHMNSLKIFSLFSNFKDNQKVLSFIHTYIHSVYIDDTQELNLLDIEYNTKKEKGYIFEENHFYLYKWIIALNIIYFIYISLHGGTKNIYNLIEFGAKYSPLIADGQYYRLFTNMLIHIGIMHLLFNNYALYSLGKDIESIYGPFKFLIIYIFSGFIGSLLSFIFNTAISAGASGAIFGLMGAYFYFGIRRPFIFSARYGMNLITMLIMNIAFGLANTNIDNFAHLGGFIGGFFVSLAIGLKEEKIFKKENIKFQICIVFILSILLNFGIHLQKNSLQYYIHTGVYYIGKNNLSHAKHVFAEGLDKNKNSEELYFYIGYTYYLEKNIEKSIFYLQKSLSINPENEMANKLLQSIKNLKL